MSVNSAELISGAGALDVVESGGAKLSIIGVGQLEEVEVCGVGCDAYLRWWDFVEISGFGSAIERLSGA